MQRPKLFSQQNPQATQPKIEEVKTIQEDAAARTLRSMVELSQVAQIASAKEVTIYAPTFLALKYVLMGMSLQPKGSSDSPWNNRENWPALAPLDRCNSLDEVINLNLTKLNILRNVLARSKNLRPDSITPEMIWDYKDYILKPSVENLFFGELQQFLRTGKSSEVFYLALTDRLSERFWNVAMINHQRCPIFLELTHMNLSPEQTQLFNKLKENPKVSAVFKELEDFQVIKSEKEVSNIILRDFRQ